MKIKNIFKSTTIITTIISLIGCSSLPKTAYTYKDELKEYKNIDELPEGVMQAKAEDGSAIEMIVNKNHKIKLISKTSPYYDTIEECKSKLKDDYKKVQESLYSDGGKFKVKETTYKDSNYYNSSNKEFNIDIKNCYEDIDQYQYNIQITPKNSNKDIPRKVAHSIVHAIGFVIALPFMIVGSVLAIMVGGIIMVSFKIAGVNF